MSDEAKRTKGPWFVDFDLSSTTISAKGVSQIGIFTVTNGAREEARANARLAAAAPDLLDALRGMMITADRDACRETVNEHGARVHTVGKWPMAAETCPACAARAAIAKAEGRTP